METERPIIVLEAYCNKLFRKSYQEGKAIPRKVDL